MGIQVGRVKAIWLCALWVLWPLVSIAQASYDFDLPAQPLADALRAVGRKAHATVVFDPALVASRNAPPLSGAYSVQEALESLLRGSRLRVRKTKGGAFWVEAIPVQMHEPPGR